VATPISSIVEHFKTDQLPVVVEQYPGNFGHPVHLACPKDFSLTPLHKLEPMAFDIYKLPRDMKITSDPEENDLSLVR